MKQPSRERDKSPIVLLHALILTVIFLTNSAERRRHSEPRFTLKMDGCFRERVTVPTRSQSILIQNEIL